MRTRTAGRLVQEAKVPPPAILPASGCHSLTSSLSDAPSDAQDTRFGLAGHGLDEWSHEMGTRKGRRIAIASVAVVVLGGAVVWIGREHI